MKLILKGGFRRDFRKLNDKELLLALADKLQKIENAKGISQITGLKLLRGYTHHFRIKVETEKYSYRIGAIVRGEAIWLMRFLPRKIAYKNFP